MKSAHASTPKPGERVTKWTFGMRHEMYPSMFPPPATRMAQEGLKAGLGHPVHHRQLELIDYISPLFQFKSLHHIMNSSITKDSCSLNLTLTNYLLDYFWGITYLKWWFLGRIGFLSSPHWIRKQHGDQQQFPSSLIGWLLPLYHNISTTYPSTD